MLCAISAIANLESRDSLNCVEIRVKRKVLKEMLVTGWFALLILVRPARTGLLARRTH